jgi:hypothetical protein
MMTLVISSPMVRRLSIRCKRRRASGGSLDFRRRILSIAAWRRVRLVLSPAGPSLAAMMTFIGSN